MTHDELCRMEQSKLVKLIDEGKLVYLPCKVGDIICLFRYNAEINEWKLACAPITKITITQKDIIVYAPKLFYPIKLSEYSLENISEFPHGLCDYYISKTKEEAERALSALKESKKNE